MKKIKERWNEFINKLTVKQCYKIIVVAILLFDAILICPYLNSINNTEELMIVILTACFMSVIGGLLIYAFLKVDVKQFWEEEKKMRLEVRKKFSLNTEEFVEVIYDPQNKSNLSNMDWQILQRKKYYAKEQDDSVIIIVKNIRGEQIGDPYTVNYYFFNNNYKPKN